MSRVELRHADASDLDRVYEYNCSPAVRAVSGNSRAVTHDEHASWFANRLAETHRSPMWIVEEDGVPVGVVRIDASTYARISIALAPDARGRAIGRQALALACASWQAPLMAEIHVDNAASRTCFGAIGFEHVGRRDAFDLFQWSPSCRRNS